VGDGVNAPEMRIGVPVDVIAVVAIPGGTLRVPMWLSLQDVRIAHPGSSYGVAHRIEATVDATCAGRGTIVPDAVTT
jgi:hypothetical protein